MTFLHTTSTITAISTSNGRPISVRNNWAVSLRPSASFGEKAATKALVSTNIASRRTSMFVSAILYIGIMRFCQRPSNSVPYQQTTLTDYQILQQLIYFGLHHAVIFGSAFQTTNENPTCQLTQIQSRIGKLGDCVRHWQSPQMLRLEFLKRPAKHRSDFRKIPVCHVAVNIC